jgi:hypothetical protein
MQRRNKGKLLERIVHPRLEGGGKHPPAVGEYLQ